MCVWGGRKRRVKELERNYCPLLLGIRNRKQKSSGMGRPGVLPLWDDKTDINTELLSLHCMYPRS